MSVLAVIPARLASTRLPRKVLLNETGKPLIQHVWEGAKACPVIDRIVIATDAEDVVRAVTGFGGEAVMTSEMCLSGTDRVAEAAAEHDIELVINIQGDEPEMTPGPLTALVEGMRSEPRAEMGTVATPWPDGVSLDDPGFVKVVTDRQGYALYFSRNVIPHYRDAPPESRDDAMPRFLKHVGLYAYRPKFLQQFAKLAPTPLERAEQLEQLRALEYGHRIAVFPTEYAGREVNTREDYDAFVARQRA